MKIFIIPALAAIISVTIAVSPVLAHELAGGKDYTDGYTGIPSGIITTTTFLPESTETAEFFATVTTYISVTSSAGSSTSEVFVQSDGYGALPSTSSSSPSPVETYGGLPPPASSSSQTTTSRADNAPTTTTVALTTTSVEFPSSSISGHVSPITTVTVDVLTPPAPPVIASTNTTASVTTASDHSLVTSTTTLAAESSTSTSSAISRGVRSAQTMSASEFKALVVMMFAVFTAALT